MNKKLEKLEGTYWKISKIIGVLFLILKYQMWTNPYSIANALLLIIGVTVGTFVAINLLDLFVGMIFGIIKYIHRKIKDKRLLKGLGGSVIDEDIE